MRKVAAALKYNQSEDKVPKVAATGYGEAARKIEQIAELENIPVYRDKVLAQALTGLGVGAEIPPELYEAIAKILIEIARLDEKVGGRE